MAGDDANANEEVDDGGEKAVERVRTVDKLVLVPVDARVFAEEDLETNLLEIVNHLLGGK